MIVGFIMLSLETAITVHSVRIDHQVEALALFLKFIDKLESVLEMDIVITCSMSNLQHHGTVVIGVCHWVRRDRADDTRSRISFRIGLRSLHEALSIMAIIKHPVIHTSACYAIMELVLMFKKEERRHGASERESFDTYLIRDYIWQALKPVSPSHEVLYRSCGKVSEILVGACAAVMARNP